MLLASRLDAQLLGRRRPRAAEEVVQRLLAVQAQDARGFRLAIRSRSSGCTAAAVDVALSAHRSLVVSWLCRGTLHLVGAADYWWLHRLTASRQMAGNAQRLRQLGISPVQTEAAVAVILAEAAAGPRTRAQLGAALQDSGVPTAGQVLVHLLAAAALDAHLVRGPICAGEHCFVDAERWLVRPHRIADRDHDLAQLAHRYLAGHGPASPQDLAVFCGITLGDARRAFGLIAEETRQLDGGFSRLAGHELERTPPPPRLLGMFDPVLHGWADRSFVLNGYPGVVTSNGMFRATALVQGRVAGTWTMPSGVVTLRTAWPLTARVRAGLEAEAADVLRFLGSAPAALRVIEDL